METLTDCQIKTARTSDEPVFELMFLLKIETMSPADYVRTKREIIEYVQTGDLGAGRALIQHAKGRRANWPKAVPPRDSKT